jgi:phospholipid/cholesterol/gamma-HCH transport system ATP-binding protein
LIVETTPAGIPVEIGAEGLVRSFGEREVLRGIDLQIHSGNIACIVGESGSGKTVLLDNLIGLMQPTAGRVLAADHNAAPVNGAPPLRDIGTLNEDQLDLIRLHWAVVFQRNALFSGSVRENIAFWLREHTTTPSAEIEKRIKSAIESVALDVNDVIDKQRDELSGGMAKRVAIARAIACDPLLIFYDEPTTGLDPGIGATIHELIFKLHNSPVGPGFEFTDLEGKKPLGREGAKRTTIIVTHDRDLLRRIRPRVILICEGRVCFDGSYEAFETTDVPEAKAYLTEMPVLHKRWRSNGRRR